MTPDPSVLPAIPPQSRALVLDSPGTLRVEERPTPVPGPGEVLLRVQAVGICGSDVHSYRGEIFDEPPGTILGHEVGAVDPRTGLTVTVNPFGWCGVCASCAAGEEQRCVKLRFDGHWLIEYIVAPAANVIPMPGASAELAALVEPSAVAIHAHRRADLRGTEDVLVIGAGPVGLLTSLVALDRTQGSVYVRETVAARLARSLSMGLTDYPNGTPVDVVFDAVGLPETFELALRAVRPGGKVLLIGRGSPAVPLEVARVVQGDLTILGVAIYSRSDFEQAAVWVRSRHDLLSLIDLRVTLEGGVEAFRQLASREGDTFKVLVEPHRN